MSFVLDAALREGHARYVWPPPPGQQYTYARARWCIRGEVWWNDGPHLDRPAVDASGELDFGHIDAWWQEAQVDHLEGDWGVVAIRNALHEVDCLS